MNRPCVLFAFDTHDGPVPEIERGVREYFRSHGVQTEFHALSAPNLGHFLRKHSGGSVGAVGWFKAPQAAAELEKNNVPFINLCETGPQGERGVRLAGEGETAARLFVDELGFDSLAFLDPCGNAERCRREFSEAAGRRGISIISPNTGLRRKCAFDGIICGYGYDAWLEQIDAFIAEVPKPVGIFCTDERTALTLYERARLLSWSVPEEISVLAVSSSRKAADSPRVLSVVDVDHARLGFHASRVVHELLLSGGSPDVVSLRAEHISHGGTTMRRQMDDPLLLRVTQLIASDPAITVPELCDQLNTGRRCLEKRFRAASNSSLHLTIVLERMKRAKGFLRNRRYNLDAISGLAGFAKRRHMRYWFKRLTGMCPRAWRERALSGERDSAGALASEHAWA